LINITKTYDSLQNLETTILMASETIKSNLIPTQLVHTKATIKETTLIQIITDFLKIIITMKLTIENVVETITRTPLIDVNATQMIDILVDLQSTITKDTNPKMTTKNIITINQETHPRKIWIQNIQTKMLMATQVLPKTSGKPMSLTNIRLVVILAKEKSHHLPKKTLKSTLTKITVFLIKRTYLKTTRFWMKNGPLIIAIWRMIN